MDSDSLLLYVEVLNPVTLGCGGLSGLMKQVSTCQRRGGTPHSLAGGVSCISPSLGPAFGSLLLLNGPFGDWVHWLTHPELFLAISTWRALVEVPTRWAFVCLPDLLETLLEGAKLHK